MPKDYAKSITLLGVQAPPNPRRLPRRDTPLAHDRLRLRLRADGRVQVDLKTAWHDGTTQLVFEPIELLEKLAAITPTTPSNYTW